MAYGNWKSSISQEQTCPINLFLEYKKWEFSNYDKETMTNQIHHLDKFVILDIWYTIKWAEWDDTANKYTNRYFSNEIKDWSEKLYLVKMSFSNWNTDKELIKIWNWKNDIKPILPKWAALNLCITLLDLNDWLVKEVFLSWNNFYKISKFIRTNEPSNICSFITKVWYTNWSKDDKWEEIIVDESFVDGLKWTEAAKYKKRYILDIKSNWEKHNDSKTIYDISCSLDDYFLSKTNWYKERYEWIKVNEIQPEVAPLANVKPDTLDNYNSNISIEDLPF